MNHKNKIKVNDMVKWNLLHDMLNTYNHTNNTNILYSQNINGCNNTLKGKAKLNNFQILLDIGCSSTIVMKRHIEKHNPKKIWCDAMACTISRYKNILPYLNSVQGR